MSVTDTSTHLDYRTLPDIVEPSQRAALMEQLLTEYDLNNPLMSQYFRAMESELVEWRTDGIYVINHTGQKYYDCLGAGGVFGLGFRHPKVIQAVKDQLDRVALSSRFSIPPMTAALAHKLVSLAPTGLNRVYFGSSGTEALEAAIKLARLTTGKAGLIGTEFGYHGMSIATLSISGLQLWRAGTEPSVGATQVLPFNNLKAMEQAIGPDTAAVILEPVQWASGCEVATTEYLKGVRQLCDRHGALLIFDEVQCGMGRCGKMWAHEYQGVTPDILCIGKVLSGGVMPISAALYTEKIARAEFNRPLFNNSSFGGNPLACAAALKTLEVIEEENLIEQSYRHGNRVNQEFAALVKDYPSVVQGQRGIGLMTCIILTRPQYGLLLQDFVRDDFNIFISSMMHMPEFVRISPPFISTDDDIGCMLGAIRQSIAKIAKMPVAEVMAYFAQLQEKFKKIQAPPE